jgi:hypothetical protein
MAEDLTKLWDNLSLNEGEIVNVNIQPQAVEGLVSRGKYCLEGKLLVDRFVGKDVVRRTLIRGWRPSGRLSFKVLGDNLFLLDFENEGDKCRVLEGRPWLFEDNLFSVENFDGLSTLSKIDFEKAIFWVRMFNVLLPCVSKEVGFQIGTTMGVAEEVDTDVDGVEWGKYLRVRIKLDLTKPLARGRMINLLGKKVMIAFQYEKLPRYCLDCGKIWHGVEECTFKKEGRKLEFRKQYGTWLRVPSPRRRDNHIRNRWQRVERECVK